MCKKALNKGKFKEINYHLSVIDWDYELAYLSVNEMYSKLLQILQPLVDSYVPLLSPPTNTNHFRPPQYLKRERDKDSGLFTKKKGPYMGVILLKLLLH